LYLAFIIGNLFFTVFKIFRRYVIDIFIGENNTDDSSAK
jgi:hypothetical protein